MLRLTPDYLVDMLKKFYSFVIILCLALPTISVANQETIDLLTMEIAQAKTDADKSRLHMYRARNYKLIGNLDLAEKDYDTALTFDHKGWIHLERARFFLEFGNNEQARKEAIAAQKETPTLKAESQKILNIAKEKVIKEQEKLHPKEILLTKKWDVQYSRTPPPRSTGKSSVRKAYAQKNKQRAKSKPRKVARS